MFDLVGGVDREQPGDHRHEAGAASDQAGRVIQRHAADHDDRQLEAALRFVEQRWRSGGGAGLGLRVEEATKGDIARALFDRLLGQIQAGMAGRSDDRLPTESRAGLDERAILLAKVQPDAQPFGERQVIIDDQVGAVALAEVAQCLGFMQAARGVRRFVAVLQ